MSLICTPDWPSVDSNAVLPHLVSSADLFDGDIFGDELIDIYNSTIAGGDGTDENDIPNLLIPPDHDEDKLGCDENHPEAQVGTTAAAMDDGLGALRPSTSFSDLTTFLSASNGDTSNNNEASTTSRLAPNLDASINLIDNADDVQEVHKNDKKRKHTGTELPASKKKPHGSKGGRNALSKNAENGMTAGQKKSSEKYEAPNPLSMEVEFEMTSNFVSVASNLNVQSSPLSTRSVSEEKFISESPTPSVSSEADYKMIAHAAVTNLIQSASNRSDSSISSIDCDGKVDTSTEHIKALTGNNWVAACTGTNASVTVVPSANDGKSNNRSRRQNLTPDERARQNRDRNREHARNTRLRKKAYVEELKRTLTELVAQRDAADLEKQQAAQRELEQREVRFRVIEEFLKLESRNEQDFSRWAAILEDRFVLTLPSATFCNMVGPSDKHEQVLDGVASVMANADCFAKFLQTLGGSDMTQPVTFQFYCDRKKFFMDGACAILEWDASSSGASKQVLESELTMKGVFRSVFSPASNKLLSASLSYDTGSVTNQLRKPVAVSRLNIDLCEEAAASVAAQAAAINTTDDFLDSLQMSRLTIPSGVNVITPSSSKSEVIVDKGEVSCDDSLTETI